MNTKHKNIIGKTFETYQELWKEMTDRNFGEVLELYYISERKRNIGHYRNPKLKEARNLIGRFLYHQKQCNVRLKFKLSKKKKFNDPLPNPKNIQEIWENLTDENYDDVHQLYKEYYRGKQNEKTIRANGLILRFRRDCKSVGFTYPTKNVTKGFKQPDTHVWRKMKF